MKVYQNPIIDHDFADPFMFKASDGFYYAYATQYLDPQETINIQVAKSIDLINWIIIGDALPYKPNWANKTQDFWAPHVIEDNGLFYLYFSAATNDKKGMAIGVAVGNNPVGPFIDSGKPLAVGESFENIDPMPFDDPNSKKKYLYWGSGFKPIKVRELADSRIEFKESSSAIDILYPSNNRYERLVEASYVIFKDGYYYLFYSGDDYRYKDTYATLVARSHSPIGPFEKLGVPILHFNNEWFSPGGNSIINDENDESWIIYHAIKPDERKDPKSKSIKRVLLMDKIKFAGNWPRIVNDSPSYLPQIAPITEKTAMEEIKIPEINELAIT
jgi:arabinan endo-1,5-alpha-L-arabinosidase